MLEWELSVERIQAMPHANDPTGETDESPPEDLAAKLFQTQMNDLGDHLEQFYAILTHADSYAMEELADAFCRAAGRPAGYHRYVHDENRQEKESKAAGK